MSGAPSLRPVSVRWAHLDGCDRTLGGRESHKGAGLARSAASAHDEDLLDLAMLSEYLRNGVAHPASASARAIWGHPKAVRRWSQRLVWSTGEGAVGARRGERTCCSVCSSVPGGAPPTKSLFSGFGDASDTGPGTSPPPSGGGCIRACRCAFLPCWLLRRRSTLPEQTKVQGKVVSRNGRHDTGAGSQNATQHARARGSLTSQTACRQR